MAARFYHLTQSSVHDTLRMLAEKSLSAGWRVLVRGTDLEKLRMLDERLWLGPEDGFLPHGIAGSAHDVEQPVLITQSEEMPNGARAVVSVDGAEVTPEMVNNMERVFVLFDGQDGAAVSRARVQWKALTEAGCSAQYWAQEEGRWVMKAEK